MEEKIIKARPEPDSGAGSSRVLKKDVYEAGLDARRILESAQREAQAIVEQAEQRRDSIIQAAHEEGYAKGLAEWADAMLAAQTAQEQLDVKYEPEMVRFAVKIAEKIIGEELRAHPDTIVSIARECLRGVRHEHNLVLRINPAESEEIQRNLESLVEVTGGGRRIQVVPDSAVAPGGCIVDSTVGLIDARLETQLKCLEEILLRVAARR